MRKTLLILVHVFMTFFVLGQQNLRFGEWEAHLPYQRGLSVTQSPNKVYYGTDFSIMSIDKEDNSLEFISKVEGLSQVGISDLKYDPTSGYILVVYTNNEIDIITEEGVINVPDIKNNLGIIGDKSILDIHFDDTYTAYLSTGFGLVSYDLENFEFGFTTQMGMNVFSATTDENNILYAATEEGVYSLDLNQKFNFADFGNWDLLSTEAGLPLIYNAKDIAFYQGELWLLTGNRIYASENDTFRIVITPEQGEEFQFIDDESTELLIGSRIENRFVSKVTYVNPELEIRSGVLGCANFITDALMDESGTVYYADEWRGYKFTNGIDGNCLEVTNRSVFSHSVSDLLVDEGQLYAASGGVTDAFNFLSNRDGIYILDENQWDNYNESSLSLLKTENFINIFKLAKHPDNGKLYLGSFYAGLLEADFENDVLTLFNSENSPILGAPSVTDIEKVGGLAFDEQNTLWISCFDADKPLVALTVDGVFHSYSVRSSAKLAGITVDQYGNKWIQVTGNAGGILVYNDKATPENPSIHEQRFINTSNSDLPTNVINCITKDLDGNIWVGTGEGTISFNCNPFDENNCNGTIPVVTEDNIPALLLQSEDVRAIAVDGGNQKWFGTRNGIFVQSPNGDDKIARFTTENSPLFDNNIIDMEFDPESGKMYIATDDGIQAYQTSTTGGGRTHRSNVYAFPNPVRPEYEGLIAFKGLARDATIKITDVNGQLVHQGTALGGQATWDGRDYSGRDVASGVYLVFSNGQSLIGDDNPDTAVTKVLIVR